MGWVVLTYSEQSLIEKLLAMITICECCTERSKNQLDRMIPIRLRINFRTRNLTKSTMNKTIDKPVKFGMPHAALALPVFGVPLL